MKGLEFIFFNETLAGRFTRFASDTGIASRVRRDEMEGFVVELPDGLDDEVSDAIDIEYDLLMKEQMVLADSEPGSDSRQAMGVAVTLADGQSRVIRIRGPLVHRLSEHFTPEEIHDLVSAIVQSVEHPEEGPLCR